MPMRKYYTSARAKLPEVGQQREGLVQTGTNKLSKLCLFLLFFIAGLAWMPAKATSVSWMGTQGNPTGVNNGYKAGDQIIYTFYVRNTGSTNLTNVMVVDTLPANTTFGNTSSGSTPLAGGRIEILIGTIAPGNVATATLTVRVSATADLSSVGYIYNTAYVNTNEGAGLVGLPATETGAFSYPTNRLPVDNGVNGISWMSLSYTGSTTKASVSAGAILTYTIRVRNSGTDPLQNVVITASVPSYTALVTADPGYTQSNQTITFPIASIAAGTPAVFTYQVRVLTDLTGVKSIPNTAFVNIGDGKGNVRTYPAMDNNASEPNLVAGNAGDATSVNVETKTAYRTWMIVLNESGSLTVSPGDIITYYIYVNNTGSTTIPSLSVSNTVPAGTEYEQGYDEFVYYRPSRTIFWTVSNLVASSTSTVRYSVKTDNNLAGYKSITNTAKVEVPEDSVRLTMACNPDDTGCELAYVTSIDVKGDRPGLFVSNVVTPNNDGKNDYFYIRNLEDYQNSKVYIFNRWGAQVYYSNNYQNDWRATGLAEGTYYYRIDLNKEGTYTTYKGWVMIIR